MNEVKTVTHKGKAYQIDKPYLFLSTNGRWEFGYLTKVDSVSQFPFINHSAESFSSIKCLPELISVSGTITPAPIELVDGAAYMFDYEGRKVDRIGIYLKHDNQFVFPIGYIHTTNCTNIRLMTVESK
jgi:hypothetical protein